MTKPKAKITWDCPLCGEKKCNRTHEGISEYVYFDINGIAHLSESGRKKYEKKLSGLPGSEDKKLVEHTNKTNKNEESSSH